MPNVFDSNRSALADLVTKTKAFTIQELYEAFKQALPDTYQYGIGGGWSIKDYLSFLVECDLLIDDFGEFRHPQKHWNGTV